MLRLFERHRIRPAVPLNQIWDFHIPGEEKIYKLPVPSAWEQHPELCTYRGRGVYETELEIFEDSSLRFDFGGVSHTADVFLDGEKIAHHYNAYTPFSALVRDVKCGTHKLRVEVDNSFSDESTLHIPNDYYTYGGITRPVECRRVADCYIKDIDFSSYFDGAWHAAVRVFVDNLKSETENLTLRMTIAGATFEKSFCASPGESEVVFDEALSDVAEWSPESPKLYFIESVLERCGEAIDDLIERVGFRTVEWKGKRILLNGKEIFLKGFNRHEDYAMFGCAVPVQLMMQDVSLMLDCGANAVRFSHYPNDERFIDICDEMGLLVWDEHHARGLSLEKMQRANFDGQITSCTEEMVREHRNHPSIIIWGIFNECASDKEEGRKMYEKQYSLIRAMDGTRLVSSASDKPLTDICFDLADVISLNLYSAWYRDLDTAADFEKIAEHIRETFPEKPIIISEFGAGAIYGFRDYRHAKWSEERQAEIVDECLRVYMGSDDVAGVFIWQFADCRVCEEVWFKTRPRTYNNKGIFDEFRREKLSAAVVRAHFKGEEKK